MSPTASDFQPDPKPAGTGQDNASSAPPPFVFPTAEDHGSPESVPLTPPEAPSEGSIDHGVAESFPASDPVSVAVTKIERPSDATEPPADTKPADDDAMPPIATPS
jgi:hypothetical protein